MPDNCLNDLYDLKESGTLVVDKLTWCELVLQRFPSELLKVNDLLEGDFSFPFGSFQARLKRFGDIFVSLTLILTTAPILILAGLLIKLEDNGPIFFSQIRNGYDGEAYKIWKLRSMRIDSEVSGAQWVKSNDDRITKVGKLLRLSRIDEIPQLLSVIQGKMSLIGPRPERPEFDDILVNTIPHYGLRYRMRPGLSGWAQVNFPYGSSEEDSAHKLSYDLFYLRNFSFLLDLLILFKTMRLVFNLRGAVPQ